MKEDGAASDTGEEPVREKSESGTVKDGAGKRPGKISAFSVLWASGERENGSSLGHLRIASFANCGLRSDMPMSVPADRVASEGSNFMPTTTDASVHLPTIVAAIAATASFIVAGIGVVFNILNARKTRRDRIAVLHFEAKLRAYADAWPALHRLVYAVMSEAITRANRGVAQGRALPLDEVAEMRRAWLPHAHILPEVVNRAAIALEYAADRLHGFVGAAGDPRNEKLRDDLVDSTHTLLESTYEAMRADCGRQEVDAHLTGLFPKPVPPPALDGTTSPVRLFRNVA